MVINDTIIWDDQTRSVRYTDADDFSSLSPTQCRQVYGVCFFQGKIVLGQRLKNNNWGLIGGTIEPGETFIETLYREIQEESNMEVLAATPIGYQVIAEPGQPVYQLRYAAVVRPYGPFVADPAESIGAITLVASADCHDYFDWGPIGDRIIQRGQELYRAVLKQYDRGDSDSQ